MSTVLRGSARATSAVAALLLVILSFGLAGAAYADPGNGNGNDGTNPGNANGADNGNGSDNGNAYGADNGNGAADDTAAVAAAAAASSNASSAKSDNSNSSSAKSSSSKGSATKSTGSSSTKSSSGAKTASDHKTKGTAATVGDVHQPQPLSGADKNSGGANGKCPTSDYSVYCSTRSGLASGNGNGGGKAVGKPCAGCVGKADNKNPPGQKPGPQDHNNGYECDGNHGIAKTNPAHTGCKPGTPPCVGAGCNPPPPPVCVGSGCNPPPPVCVGAGCNPPPPVVCPPGTVMVNGVCVFGEEDVLCPDGSVMPPSGKCDKAKPPTVLGEEAFRPPVKVKAAQAGVLPATGASSGLGPLAGLGFVMLALGAGVMMRRRTD
jgi:LPXTG-motif cell wall-anchored protein